MYLCIFEIRVQHTFFARLFPVGNSLTLIDSPKTPIGNLAVRTLGPKLKKFGKPIEKAASVENRFLRIFLYGHFFRH